MLQVEQHAGGYPWIPLVHQDGAAPEQVAVSFKSQVDRRVEKRVARGDERREWLAMRRYERLFESDPLISGQDGRTGPDQAVPVPDRGWNVGDFVPPRFPLLPFSAQPPERFEKERFDVMGLEAPGLRALHILPDISDTGYIHDIVGQRPFFEEVLNLGLVEGVSDHLCKPCPHVRLLSVPDRVDQQFPQRSPFELELAEDVEHPPAKRLTRLLELLKKRPVHIPFPGLISNQVP